MLLLGHACWAYLTGRLAAYPLGVRPNLYLLLVMGMLPDVDLVLGVFGIQHRTLTHSFIFWSLLFGPVFAKYRTRAVPYFLAVTQHILLGDLVVGRTDVLWPLEVRIGLGLPILSPINLGVEAAGLALFFALSIKNRDILSTLPIVLPVLVIVPLIGFVLLASFSDHILPIFLEGSDARYLERNLPTLLSNPDLQVAVFLHLALISVILVSIFKAPKKTGTSQEVTRLKRHP